MKQTLVWFNLQEMEEEMDCLAPSMLLQKVCTYKCRFCTKACGSSKLSSHVHMIAEYLVCQIPIKMLKQHAITNSSLHNLKIYSSKGCRKTSQKCKTSQRCRWIYLANKAILNIRIFSRRYHFRLWVFASTGEYFYCWHWRVLRDVLQSKYDINTFKNFLRFDLTNHHRYCILQIGSFN